MKKLFVSILLASSALYANAKTDAYVVERVAPGEVMSLWAGYVAGAFTGAYVFAANTASTIGMTAAGTPIVAVSSIGLFGSAIAGGVIGAATAVFAYRGVIYVVDNHGSIVAKITKNVDSKEDDFERMVEKLSAKKTGLMYDVKSFIYDTRVTLSSAMAPSERPLKY